ncbi:MAG: ribonuclease HII [Clostridiales bacterium]|nr:ribonuclease HII [Clostridiales bacterium]MBD8942686.1 ribonuclease HII [Clostridiales bacterium]
MAGIKISDIKEEFAASNIEGYTDLIAKYSDDERAGVINLIKRYQKEIDKHNKEVERTYNMQAFERKYGEYQYICGIDEVGRGPLAGPVCAGAVILPKDVDILYINDSKQLSTAKREELYDIIKEKAIAVKTAYSSPEVIDDINILQATYRAMREAINELDVKPDILLNDAVNIPEVNIKQVPIIKGDAKSISIAAASIIAKVERDRLMVMYDELYPEYGFAKNKGYGSKEHIEALRKYGPCPIHRRSFIKGLI